MNCSPMGTKLAGWMAFAALLPVLAVARGQEQPQQPPTSETAPPSPKPKAKTPGALPWEEAPRTSEPVLRPPSGPVEILERYDIGESQLAGFFSGQPLGASE